MTEPSAAATVPVCIDSGGDQVLGLFDPAPSGAPAAVPVLICAPWGWDEVASYRVRREWATRLAAAGHSTLRFDLPGTGNSSGAPSEPDLLTRWVAAVGAAAGWLAGTAGGTGVAALGLGLGGLLALEALAPAGAIAAVALWATPASGKRFVRESRAFSRMQPWQAGVTESGFDPGVPEGWLEAGGFALSPETQAALGALTPDPGPTTALRHALLLDRDGIAVDAKLVAKLEASGAEVTLAAGPGWGEMVSHPERARLPESVAAELESWLADGLAPAVTPPRDAPADLHLAPNASLELEVAGGGDEPQIGVREVSAFFGQPWGRAFGVTATAAGAAAPDGSAASLCAVFLNAGAVRNVGPSRLWVETARRWAGRGVAAARVDLQGIGEADGEAPAGLTVGAFYGERYRDEIGGVLDELERRGLGSRFLLVGLCAGGYWAFRSAVEDPRVAAAFAVNAGALRWHSDLLAQREARKGSRAFDAGWWQKLLAGEVPLARITGLVRSLVVDVAHRLRDLVGRRLRGAEPPLIAGIEADLDALRDSGTPVLLAFSGAEALGAEVEADGLSGQPDRWPGAKFATLPGSDHTLRPLAAQRGVADLLDDALGKVLELPQSL